MNFREIPPGLLQYVLTVLVFWSWVLVLPRLPPSSRSLRLFAWASILLYGRLGIAWICCPQLPRHPCKNGTHSTCFCSTGGHTPRIERLAKQGLPRQVSRGAWKRRINELVRGQTVKCKNHELGISVSKILAFQFTVCTPWFMHIWTLVNVGDLSPELWWMWRRFWWVWQRMFANLGHTLHGGAQVLLVPPEPCLNLRNLKDWKKLWKSWVWYSPGHF